MGTYKFCIYSFAPYLCPYGLRSEIFSLENTGPSSDASSCSLYARSDAGGSAFGGRDPDDDWVVFRCCCCFPLHVRWYEKIGGTCNFYLSNTVLDGHVGAIL